MGLHTHHFLCLTFQAKVKIEKSLRPTGRFRDMPYETQFCFRFSLFIFIILSLNFFIIFKIVKLVAHDVFKVFLMKI